MIPPYERKPGRRGRPKKVLAVPPGYWGTRTDAAHALTVVLGQPISGTQVDNWSVEVGCPLPAGGGPIEQAAMIAWVRQRLERKAIRASPDPEREVRTRLLAHKLATLEGHTVPVSEVRADISRAGAILRRTLLEEMPTRLYSVCKSQPLDDAIEEVRRLLTEAINLYADEAQRTVTEAKT